MSKKVAILQSSYIPWKGYFDQINMVDEFILYDDMQFTRRDWRNRNLIKTANGLNWITIPVQVKGKFLQKINETIINDKSWASNHWKTIVASYSKAKHFKEYSSYIETLYRKCEDQDYLSNVNYIFLHGICSLLNIATHISWSTDYAVDDHLKKTERLLAVCRRAGATHYITGPSASKYIELDLFNSAGIEVIYADYSDYPVYPQLHGNFEHGVTILDLIFNTGADASSYLKSTSVAEVA